jgi:hypothetical protein
MPSSASSNRAELADVGRLARRLLDRAVETARAENRPLRRLLLDHLGPDAPSLPTVSATWPSYEHVNVQVGLDAWLAGDPAGRTHEVYGITGIGFMRQMEIVGIGDLIVASGGSAFSSAGAAGVMTTALPSGPGGQTRACVSHGVYLVHDGGAGLAMVLQPVTRGPNPEVVLQIAGADQAHLDAVLREIRQLASDRSVFRGQVISFGPEVFGLGRQTPMISSSAPPSAATSSCCPKTCWAASNGRFSASAGTPAGSWPAASTSSAASCCTARPAPARRTPCATSSASCPR